MKIMTILGTRPEIIRLSLIINKLDKYAEHIFVHTGQNYDERLSKIFFEDMEIREPDYYLGVKTNSFYEQIAGIIYETGKLLKKIRPDALLILGDTNSGLASITARRLGIPVFHMEAGNRCFDDRVPEEINRRVIDHSSSILMPYTNKSKENLLLEGIHPQNIYVIGNPIFEIIEHYSKKLDEEYVLQKMELEAKRYFLVTMHRAENVDVPDRLTSIINALKKLHQKYDIPVICSLHPRTRDNMEQLNISTEESDIKYIEPLGFTDFLGLEKNAFCVLTDSGTVQEECCIFKTKNVTIRDTTERPETIEVGSNIISGIHENTILNCVNIAVNEPSDWQPPLEYLVNDVSSRVIKIIMGYFHK